MLRRKALLRAKAQRSEVRPTPSDAQTLAEIRRLEGELKHAPQDAVLGAGDEGVSMRVSLRVLTKIIDPAARLRTPDPLERYGAEMVAIRQIDRRFDTSLIQRCMVLTATLAHLKAIAKG